MTEVVSTENLSIPKDYLCVLIHQDQLHILQSILDNPKVTSEIPDAQDMQFQLSWAE